MLRLALSFLLTMHVSACGDDATTGDAAADTGVVMDSATDTGAPDTTPADSAADTSPTDAAPDASDADTGPATRACCLIDSTCLERTEEACLAEDGYHSFMSMRTCDTAMCPDERQGACCMGGECMDDTTVDACATGGTHAGEGTRCAMIDCSAL